MKPKLTVQKKIMTFRIRNDIANTDNWQEKGTWVIVDETGLIVSGGVDQSPSRQRKSHIPIYKTKAEAESWVDHIAARIEAGFKYPIDQPWVNSKVELSDKSFIKKQSKRM